VQLIKEAQVASFFIFAIHPNSRLIPEIVQKLLREANIRLFTPVMFVFFH